MSTYPFMQVDAFTDHPLGGNPCAIVFEADDLSVETMQAVAREMNLSETSFVMKSASCDVRVRYFTVSAEIPLAGHPTIATAFALVDSGRIQLNGDVTTVYFELNVGPIRVDIHGANGKMQRAVMSQLKPKFLATVDASVVMPAFGLRAEDAISGAPIQVVSTGTPQLMVCVHEIEALGRIKLDPDALSVLMERYDFFCAHIFARQGATSVGNTFARDFASTDAFEDPYTGSATGGMGAYLWHYGLIDQPTFLAEQGHWIGRPGIGTVEVIGPRHDIETVKVGGGAAAVLRGEMML